MTDKTRKYVGAYLSQQTKKPKYKLSVWGFVLDKRKSLRALRDISLLTYLIHPAMIAAVYGFARAVCLQKSLVENNAVYFFVVAISSVGVSVILVIGFNYIKKLISDPSLEPRAWVEINLLNLKHNIAILRQALPDKTNIMAVVKADAYGHGIHAILKCLEKNGIDTYAVATLEEVIQLRKCGIKGEILILGYTPYGNTSMLYKYRLSQTIVNAEHAKKLDSFGKPIKAHIKINTGMNRLGENHNHTDDIVNMFSSTNLKIEGIYTHLGVSDSLEETDVVYTNCQIQNFYELLERLKKKGIAIPKTHIQSSYGVLNYPELNCDYARIGIALYGVLSAPGEVRNPLDLRPVLSLKSRVALIRTVFPGEKIGYGRSFTAERKMKIAVISIGYGDGYPRNLSNTGHVLIKGIKAPIIGRICMDQLMVDVTKVQDVQLEDIVTLIGTDGNEVIMAEQLAVNGESITNEILCRLGHRLKP